MADRKSALSHHGGPEIACCSIMHFTLQMPTIYVTVLFK